MSLPTARKCCTIFFVASLIFQLACVQAYQTYFPTYNNEYQTDSLLESEPQNSTVSLASGGQKVQNVIDSCWRKNPEWAKNRKQLADCAKGFGSGAFGGKNGAIYVVTDDSDNVADPKPGTLRYGIVQEEPLWIIFQKDMVIKLENDLIINSFKTIDGRGAKVVIGNNGPCIKIKNANHVIIHGISLVDCKPGKSEDGGVTDGDAISVLASSKVWIDHCHLERAIDGLIDVTHASTGVTISNNFFTQHDKVMLLGHSDTFPGDKVMEVTVAFNHFGPGCVQRMPRVRFGYAHVANNRYTKWEMYAIGGSSNPTILSEGNYFLAPDTPDNKQITDRHTEAGPPWQTWKWRSVRDMYLNGAYFVQSGSGPITTSYTAYQAFPVANGNAAPSLTMDAGPLPCIEGRIC